MSGNLFLMEMKRNFLSFLLWMTAIVLLVSLTMSVYPSFLENQTKIMGMMNLLPEGMLQFKGISNFQDLLTVLGFYSVNNIIYMMVLGSIFAIVLSCNILLKEEYNKTAEFLFTKPAGRSEIFFSKILVVFVYIFLLNLAVSLAGFISMEIVRTEPYNFRAFFILSLYTFLLNVFFGAAGLFLSTLIRRPKPITTFCIGLVMIFYFILTISKITESASDLGYLSPFRYVDTDVLNPEYGNDLRHLFYLTGASVLLTCLSLIVFRKKDIYT